MYIKNGYPIRYQILVDLKSEETDRERENEICNTDSKCWTDARSDGRTHQ